MWLHCLATTILAISVAVIKWGLCRSFNAATVKTPKIHCNPILFRTITNLNSHWMTGHKHDDHLHCWQVSEVCKRVLYLLPLWFYLCCHHQLLWSRMWMKDLASIKIKRTIFHFTGFYVFLLSEDATFKNVIEVLQICTCLISR